MPSSRWAVLQISDFRIILTTRLSAWLGLQMQAVIVGWQIYQLRPDPLLLGMIGLAEAIPAIACSFVSGHMVDVRRPASVLRLSLTTLFFNSILLCVAVAPQIRASEDARIALLFAAVFISGAGRSFTSPAVFSLMPQVVSRSLIAPASAWHSSMFQIATITGPALGGLIYATFGAQVAFAMPLFFMSIALFAVNLLSKKTRELRSQGTHEPFLQSIRSGLRFAFGQRVLLSTMALDMFSVLFGGAIAVLPIYADQVLGVGSTGLGLLRAAPAVGSIIIAFTMALRPMRVISGRTLLWAVAGFGVSTLLFAVSTNFLLSLICLAATGAFDGVSMIIRQTILQLLTPDHMRGRLSSISSVFITSSNEIGAFESGVAAKALGLVPSVLFGGAMTLIVVAATAVFAPELRKTRITTDDLAKS